MKELTLRRVRRVTTFVQVKRKDKHLNGTKHMKTYADNTDLENELADLIGYAPDEIGESSTIYLSDEEEFNLYEA